MVIIEDLPLRGESVSYIVNVFVGQINKQEKSSLEIRTQLLKEHE